MEETVTEAVVPTHMPAPATEGPATETSPPKAALQHWQYDGATMTAANSAGPRTGSAGVMTLGELQEFIDWVDKHMPDATVLVHAYGLRAVRTQGVGGPKLEWDDWT